MTTVAVFGSSATEPGSPEWADAVWLGGAIAERGWAVATGGYGGTMEAVSEGAAAVGGRVVGVTAPAVFPGRHGTNPHVIEERQAGTIAARIATIVDGSDAAVALPGSIGTLAELVVAWNTAFVAPFRSARPRPVVAVGTVWAEVVGILSKTLPTGRGFITTVPDVGAAVETLERHDVGVGDV